MTIQTSGPMTYPTALNDELRRTGPLTTPDAVTRWLAEVPSGPVVIPNDFYSKSAVKLINRYTSGGTSHLFTASFGPEYTGRRIVLVTNLASGNDTPLTMTSVVVGGAPGSGNSNGSFASGVSAGTGIFLANPSGTSGTISFTTANAANAQTWVLSVAGITARHDWDIAAIVTNPGGSMSVDVPANGVLIAGYTRANTGGHSYTGVTLRDDILFQAGTTRGSFAWTNRLNSQSGRPVTVSPTGTNARGAMVASFS